MPIDLVECLKKLKKDRAKAALKEGCNDISKDWVFPSVADIQYRLTTKLGGAMSFNRCLIKRRSAG